MALPRFSRLTWGRPFGLALNLCLLATPCLASDPPGSAPSAPARKTAAEQLALALKVFEAAGKRVAGFECAVSGCALRVARAGDLDEQASAEVEKGNLEQAMAAARKVLRSIHERVATLDQEAAREAAEAADGPGGARETKGETKGETKAASAAGPVRHPIFFRSSRSAPGDVLRVTTGCGEGQGEAPLPGKLARCDNGNPYWQNQAGGGVALLRPGQRPVFGKGAFRTTRCGQRRIPPAAPRGRAIPDPVGALAEPGRERLECEPQEPSRMGSAAEEARWVWRGPARCVAAVIPVGGFFIERVAWRQPSTLPGSRTAAPDPGRREGCAGIAARPGSPG